MLPPVDVSCQNSLVTTLSNLNTCAAAKTKGTGKEWTQLETVKQKVPMVFEVEMMKSFFSKVSEQF